MNGETPNLVDLLLAVLIALSAWGGWRRGFAHAVMDLAVLLNSLLAALVGYRYLAAAFDRVWPALGVWSTPLAFLLVWLLLRGVLGAVATAVLRKVPERAHAHRANRALGVLPGGANGLVNATLVSMLLLSAPMLDGLTVATRDSVIAQRLAPAAEWLEAQLSPVFDDAADRTLSRLTLRPQSTETVQLPFRTARGRERPDLEARMLTMLNAERQQHGLKPLAADPALTAVARGHSRDMLARGYFSHLSPEGRTPFDRMRADGLRFITAGENLALAQTLPTAHQGLMNSPGHRANILRPGFGRVGIGVIDAGMYGLMVTQKFRN